MKTAPLRNVLLAGLAVLCAGTSMAGIELHHANGETLRLEQPAARLVTLAPHLAELVFAAGAGETLLATVEYSDFPEPVNHLPRIGDAFRFDLERIVALKPDLVLVWASGNPGPAQARLAALGLTTWRIEIRTPDDIADTLSAIGRATGNDPAGRSAADGVRRTIARLRTQFADRSPITYFYQVAERPLFTVNGEHLISQALDLCGAQNVFADLPQLAPQLSREAVLAANPRVLMAGRVDEDNQPLAQWSEWPRLQAVQAGALLYLDANRISRATPRMLESVENACNLMDPYRQ